MPTVSIRPHPGIPGGGDELGVGRLAKAEVAVRVDHDRRVCQEAQRSRLENPTIARITAAAVYASE